MGGTAPAHALGLFDALDGLNCSWGLPCADLEGLTGLDSAFLWIEGWASS